jgi:type I restriction enzyme M protein
MMKLGTVSLDIFWLKDKSWKTPRLPAPEVLAAEILDKLEMALEPFKSICE